ncbi:MAG: motif [Blastocatellia bacterium]|nr:motif [Blastocatellia bacterium]
MPTGTLGRVISTSGKIGRNEPCPCGSGSKYKKCHGKAGDTSFTAVPKPLMEPIAARSGETPQWLKSLVEAAIKHTFDGGAGILFMHSQLGRSVRGELCAPVALLVQWLLNQYGIKSRVVFGSAEWKNYPFAFRWKGAAEYHAWVETEYGEIVDLACDAINHRSSLAAPISILPPPKSCWEKPDQLTGRVYEEVRYGGQEIDIDLPGSPAFDSTAKAAMQYARTHEVEFRKELD